jgi:DNA polymerase III subunit gamma/tau
MSAAIYQRTRPIHWDEVIGQEHVKDVLRPALERGRIGHAYLFSGPRGVGKTTTARLIAMTVNCDDNSGIVKPCGKCESCRMVMSGRHPDVLEIDAASNNSVDDVRDLREKVALQPMRGDKKVYILDEAHMMSKSAFNALLKTLEEPPAHAVFILATTEPERLPPTILSRCQHYRFRRHSVTEIAGKLQKICDAEGVSAAPEALTLMARSADGAMRDGESLLERMLAAGEPALTLRAVEGALGLPPQDRLHGLGMALARGDSASVLSGLSALYADGFAPRTITERVKIALRDVLHAQLDVDGARTKGERENAEKFEPSLLLKLIRALDEEDARFARSSDLIALEMAFTKALVVAQGLDSSHGMGDGAVIGRVAALEKLVREGGGQARASGAAPSRPSVPDFDPTSRARPTPVKAAEPEMAVPDDDDREPAPNRAFVREHESRGAPQKSPTSAAPSSSPTSSSGGPTKTWGDVVLKAKAQLKAFLMPAKVDIDGDLVVIRYSDPRNNFHASSVAGKLEDVAALVREVMGAHYGVELVMPDGSKKNPPSNAQAASAPRPAVSQPAASVGTVVAAVVAEVVGARQEVSRQAAVQTLEREEPASRVEPMLERAAIPRVNAIGAIIETPLLGLREPDALAFQQLGSAKPEISLFGTPMPPPEAAEPPLEGEEELEQTAIQSHSSLDFAAPDPELVQAAQLEITSLETATLEPEAFEDDPLPSDPMADIPTSQASLNDANLETFDLSAAPDAPPLEAFDLDFGDVSAPPRPRGFVPTPSSVTGHVNYAPLSKLFSHRVVGAGRLEVKAAVPTGEVVAASSTAAPPADAVSEDTE